MRDSTIKLVLSHGVEPDNFIARPVAPEPANADVWQYLMAHHQRFRQVPSEDLFQARWPHFVLIDEHNTLDVVLEHFVRTVKRRALIDEIRNNLSPLADDWDRVGEAEVYLIEAGRNMSRLLSTTGIVRFSDSLVRRDDWMRLREEKERTGQTPGISFFFQELDDLTYGAQPGEFVIYEGFLGKGKSTLAIIQAAHNYLELDKTALVMSPDAADAQKLANRWDSYMAGISYRALKRLELGEGDLEKWERIGEKAQDSRMEKDILVVDDMWKPTIDKIYAEIERWPQAHYAVLDTIDEVRTPSQYRTIYDQMNYAARELRTVARQTKKPLIAVAQAGREAEQEGAKIGNIAGAIDIARKADIVFGLHADEQMVKMNKMKLSALKLRDDENKSWSGEFYWNPAVPEFRAWTDSDGIPKRQTVGV